MDKLMKTLIALIYKTEKKAKQYLIENPTETILTIDISRGVKTDDVHHYEIGDEWEFGKSSTLILTNKKIVYKSREDNNQWVILIEDITVAKLNSFMRMFGNEQVLRIQTKNGENYQFGMQLNPEWTQQTILPLTLEKSAIKKYMLWIMFIISAIIMILVSILKYCFG
jgi:hypothetical protein